jgi:hypothetical protein
MHMETVPPIRPACPNCGKEMRPVGHTPTCDSVIYDFLCSDDGNRLSWWRRRVAANAQLKSSVAFNARPQKG